MGDKFSPEFIDSAKSDPGAFGRIYDHYYGVVLNYIYRQVLDLDIAEELTSSAFFNLVRALPKYRQKGSFTAWVYKIALNEVKMYYRADRNRKKREEEFQRERLEEVYFEAPYVELQEEKKQKIRQYRAVLSSIDELPEKYRQAIVIRFIENLSYEDIGRVLDKRVGTVKALVHRGLEKIRLGLEETVASV